MTPEAPTSEKALRVVFVCPEEPSVMPLFFERVIPTLREEIAAIAVVSPIYKRSSWVKQAKQFAGAFGLWEFVLEAMGYVRYKVADVLPFGRRYSVKRIARANGKRLRQLGFNVNFAPVADVPADMTEDELAIANSVTLAKQPA